MKFPRPVSVDAPTRNRCEGAGIQASHWRFGGTGPRARVDNVSSYPEPRTRSPVFSHGFPLRPKRDISHMHKSRAPDMKTALEAVMTSLRLAYGAGSLVLLSMLSGQASSQAAPPPPPAVTVAKPIVKEIIEQDDFIGRFEAVDQVDIRARVSGYLDKVHFQDGTLVKAGDLLFTIDQRPYQAAFEEAEASVASAQVRLEFASNDLDRAESLRQSGNIADQVLDQRRIHLPDRPGRARPVAGNAAPGAARPRIHRDQSAVCGPHLAASSSRRATSSTPTRRS